MPIELWVSTSVHETLLTRWTAPFPTVRIRRAPGFRAVADDGTGRNPVLPAKMPMLLRLLPYLRSATVVVCAEQTSLWLPRLFPMRAKFVKTFARGRLDERARRSAAAGGGADLGAERAGAADAISTAGSRPSGSSRPAM